ncbi:MAG TPA: MFS transporter, partial [Patescibacteria group bacterium]|nr:MFS transporter [Patescibacteria group bacterium]
MAEPASRSNRLTVTQWLICFIASVGFAFDIYELLVLPLIVKPALGALGGAAPGGGPMLVPGSPEFTYWARLLFFVPALVGGIFGLLGGYLTDRLGRRRVLAVSILLYAGSALASGFATTLMQLLVLRCLVFIGVCVEFVAAVAWLAELFPEARQREKVLGYTQAFSSLGGLMVALANRGCIALAASLPAIHGSHDAWRYTLISGLVPAIPLILIRPFLPESPVWQQRRAAGTLKRPSLGELFKPEFRRTTIVTTVLFACSYAIAFGAIQHLPQMVPGMADVKAASTAAKEALQQDAAVE